MPYQTHHCTQSFGSFGCLCSREKGRGTLVLQTLWCSKIGPSTRSSQEAYQKKMELLAEMTKELQAMSKVLIGRRLAATSSVLKLVMGQVILHRLSDKNLSETMRERCLRPRQSRLMLAVASSHEGTKALRRRFRIECRLCADPGVNNSMCEGLGSADFFAFASKVSPCCR